MASYLDDFAAALLQPTTQAQVPALMGAPGPFGVPDPSMMPTTPTAPVSAPAPMAPPAAPPPSPDTPLVDPNALRAALAGALSGQNTQSPEDARSRALMQMGIQLMQPRQPGQTIAGQVGNAAGGAISYLDQARQQRAQEGMQRVQTMMKANEYDMNMKKLVLDMADTKEKLKWLPQEKQAEIGLKLEQAKTAIQQGNLAAAEAAYKDTQIANAGDLASAEIEQRRALADEARAKAASATKEGEWRDAQIANEKLQVQSIKLSDGSAFIMEKKKDGTVDRYIISARDQSDAALQLQGEIKKGLWKTVDEQNGRMLQLIAPKKMMVDGVGTQKPVAPAAPKSMTLTEAEAQLKGGGGGSAPAAPVTSTTTNPDWAAQSPGLVRTPGDFSNLGR